MEKNAKTQTIIHVFCREKLKSDDSCHVDLKKKSHSASLRDTMIPFYMTCEWQIPTANVIFFSGDRCEGTGNPVIDRLSNLQRIAEILVSKFGGSINAWVIEASTFSGPFAVYKDFIPTVNSWGEPKSYNPTGFPASASTITLLSNCLQEVCVISLCFHASLFVVFDS